MKVTVKYRNYGDHTVVEQIQKGFENSNNVAVTVVTVYALMEALVAYGFDMKSLLEDMKDSYAGSAKKAHKSTDEIINMFVESGQLDDLKTKVQGKKW